MTVHVLPAWTDNYIFVIRDDSSDTTIVVDPAESGPVLALCAQQDWKVSAILLTHHHPDHISGVKDLTQKFNCAVWGHKKDAHRLPPLTQELEDGAQFDAGALSFEVRFTPAHTLGHICYWIREHKMLFCGDTLFSMGCGRLFEGTPEMMLKNMRWIRSLPHDTHVYCAHEYTRTNTEFALSLEPQNASLQTFYQSVKTRRANEEFTVPFLLSQEIALNPFLRWDDKNLRKALGLELATDLDVFTHLREQRNQWR